ncbi:MAG: hypothetical protein DRI44_02655 [Chlamydiae bacterium]|nr:MAG: hypothetical protein DRI44_02655 [Chlamydiota bacterium]
MEEVFSTRRKTETILRLAKQNGYVPLKELKSEMGLNGSTVYKIMKELMLRKVITIRNMKGNVSNAKECKLILPEDVRNAIIVIDKYFRNGGK